MNPEPTDRRLIDLHGVLRQFDSPIYDPTWPERIIRSLCSESLALRARVTELETARRDLFALNDEVGTIAQSWEAHARELEQRIEAVDRLCSQWEWDDATPALWPRQLRAALGGGPLPDPTAETEIRPAYGVAYGFGDDNIHAIIEEQGGVVETPDARPENANREGTP